MFQDTSVTNVTFIITFQEILFKLTKTNKCSENINIRNKIIIHNFQITVGISRDMF